MSVLEALIKKYGADPFLWMDYSTLRANPPPEVKFLWGDKTNGLFQEKSFMMVHSAEKRGKSMFTLNLAIAGARADPEFLGFVLREGGFRTLILQCEVHLRAIYERFQQMLENGDLTDEQAKNIMFNGYRAVTLTNPAHLFWFKWRLRKWKPDLVIVDPLAHMLTEDENSNVAVGRGLAPLLNLRDNPGCAVCVVHHDGKVSEGTGSRPVHQRSRGANRLTADPDSIISLTPIKNIGGPTSRMSCTPRYGRVMVPIRVRLNEDTFWFERYSNEQEHADDLKTILIGEGGLVPEDKLIPLLADKWNLHDVQHDHRTVRARIARAVKDEAIYKYELKGEIHYGATMPTKEE